MARVRDSSIGTGLRGRVGEVVYVQGVNGTQIRKRPLRVGPLSPAQQAAAFRMERIAAFWARVDLAGVEAWRTYAESLVANLPALQRRPMPAYNAFLALATRLTMIDPAADVPLLPPAAPFPGDAVRVTLSSLDSAVVFSANRANAPGVVTELLFQRLANEKRLPRPDGYRSQGFVAFVDGALEVIVPALPGAYACAYRFVDATDGQATALLPCGVVQIG